ncbi:MAG: division plane positioning ATPase MipZ, partial [Pseudomonadota bacterium]
ADGMKILGPSVYSQMVWNARQLRAQAGLKPIDWIVVRNRTGFVEARNQSRLEKALNDMAQRVGFRAVKGLSERVIYRELFPSGLTLLDKGHLGELGTSHLVARQELRALIHALGLTDFSKASRPMEMA